MAEDRKYLKKRRVPRRAFRRNIGLLVRGEYFVSEAYELGDGGMMVASPVPLSEGQMVVLSFQVPGMLHIVTRGIVRYHKKESSSNPECYGVQFVKIDFDAKRRVRSYVALKSTDEDAVGAA